MTISQSQDRLVYQRGYTLADIQSLIERHNLNRLEIRSILRSDDYGDLSFLKDATFLRSLRIVSRAAYDLSFLPSLNNLKWLALDVKGFANSEVFADLPLKSLYLSMQRIRNNIRVPLSLDLLFLQEVDAASLSFITNPQNLKSFEVRSSKIRSLDGIQNFVNLQSLKLGGVSALKVINGTLPLTLKTLTLDEIPSLTLLNLPSGLVGCDIAIKFCKKLNFEASTEILASNRVCVTPTATKGVSP